MVHTCGGLPRGDSSIPAPHTNHSHAPLPHVWLTCIRIRTYVRYIHRACWSQIHGVANLFAVANLSQGLLPHLASEGHDRHPLRLAVVAQV